MKDGEVGRTRSISGVAGICHRSGMKGLLGIRMKLWVQRAHWTGYRGRDPGFVFRSENFSPERLESIICYDRSLEFTGSPFRNADGTVDPGATEWRGR